MNEILATIPHGSTVLETNVEESKAKIVSDTDQAVYALKWWCRLHEQRSCICAESERLVTSAEREYFVQYFPRGGVTADDCNAT